MNGVNKWRDEMVAKTKECNKLKDTINTLKKELTLSREAITRLTERIRELEAAPKFNFDTIFGGVVK